MVRHPLDPANGEPAPQWQPLPSTNVQAPAVRPEDLAVADQRVRLPVDPPEPAVPEISAGEWPATQVVEVVERLAAAAPSELWLLDPTDQRLIYGRWVLDEDGLERLRVLHRAGVRLARRPTVAAEVLQPRLIRWLTGFLQVTATLGLTLALLSLVIWLHPSEEMLGWPEVPLIGAALAGMAAAVVRWLRKRGAKQIGEPPIAQIHALADEIGRRRVGAPSAAAVTLAMQIRETWKLSAGRRGRTPTGAAWERRFDELLYGLALSQPGGTRPGRPELQAWVEENSDRLIAALHEGAPAPPPLSPAKDSGINDTTPAKDPFIHYPGYHPTDPS